MSTLSLRLCRLFLPLALQRACKSTIPRSGEDGEKVNCFTVSIDKEAAPYLIALELLNDNLRCIEWNGKRYESETTVPLANILPGRFRITHYYGLSEITYFGIYDFAFGRLTRWPYLKILIARSLSRFDQYIFNKKKLVTKQRIDLLRFLVAKSLDGHEAFEQIDLMTELYSIRWVLHPDSTSQQKKLDLYIDSLVHTGELKKVNHKYVLTGSALRAVEDYEEQERKHTENVKIQRRMFWLTFAIVLLTIVQAGLIKLPAIVDLTSESQTSVRPGPK
jgi:hypothetical protein